MDLQDHRTQQRSTYEEIHTAMAAEPLRHEYLEDRSRNRLPLIKYVYSPGPFQIPRLHSWQVYRLPQPLIVHIQTRAVLEPSLCSFPSPKAWAWNVSRDK